MATRSAASGITRPYYTYRINLGSWQASNLVAWWPLDRHNYRYDLSGNRLHWQTRRSNLISRPASSGAVTAPGLGSSQIGHHCGLEFIGGDNVSIGAAPALSRVANVNALTASFWVHRATAFPSGQAALFGFRATPAGGAGWDVGLGGNGADTNRIYYRQSGAPGTHRYSTVALTTGQLHHVAVTYNDSASGELRFYIDGNLVTTIGGVPAITNFTGFKRIFARSNGSLEMVSNAWFRDLRVYAQALSQPQIAELCNPNTYLDLYEFVQPRSYFWLIPGGGDGDSQFPVLGTTGSAEAFLAGTGDCAFPVLGTTGSGEAYLEGSGDMEFPVLGTTGSGEAYLEGTGDSAFPVLETSGSGEAYLEGTGDSAFPVLETSGSGEAYLEGSGNSEFPVLETSGSGEAYLEGSGDTEFPVLETSGSGEAYLEGSGDSEFPVLTTSGLGSAYLSGTGDSVFPVLGTNGFGPSTIVGTGDSAFPVLSVTVDAAVPDGLNICVFPGLLCVGTGSATPTYTAVVAINVFPGMQLTSSGDADPFIANAQPIDAIMPAFRAKGLGLQRELRRTPLGRRKIAPDQPEGG